MPLMRLRRAEPDAILYNGRVYSVQTVPAEHWQDIQVERTTLGGRWVYES
jgi:hypothetical protein